MSDDFTPEEIERRFNMLLRFMMETPPMPRRRPFKDKLRECGVFCPRCQGTQQVIHEGGYVKVPCPVCSKSKIRNRRKS